MTAQARKNKGVQAKNQGTYHVSSEYSLVKARFNLFKIVSSTHTFNEAIELLLACKQGCPENFLQWIQLGKSVVLAMKNLAF